MRASLFTLACLFAAFSYACSDTSGPTTTCGAGTQNVNGECQTLVTCGEGTTNVDNTCVPTTGANCGAGTEEVDGLCVPSETACEEGTHLNPDTGLCVPDFEVVCGSGTELGDDGVCVPSDLVSCGPGTVLQEGTTAGGTTFSTCVPICDLGQIYDEGSGECVDQCAPGTVFNGDTGTCRPRCVNDEYYSVSLDACVHVPECLRNTILGEPGGDCEGWPFQELTIETACARRAFYICDSMFDCDCPHGGMMDFRQFNEDIRFEGERASDAIIIGPIPIGNGDGVDRLLDYSSCLAEHYTACDQGWDVSLNIELEEMGLLAVDDEGLIDFDNHFAIEEGTCTRPVGWEMWPWDLFEGMFEGALDRGEDCHDRDFGDVVCSTIDYCAYDEEYEQANPFEPEYRYTCQARATAGEPCGAGERPCAGDLLCLPVRDDEGQPTQEYRCRGPILENVRCDSHSECAAGLYCRPTDLSAYFSSPWEGNAYPTCQKPLLAGVRCPGEAWEQYRRAIARTPYRYNDAEAHHIDLCGANLYCRGAHSGNDFVGTCEAATTVGEACNWCSERAFEWGYDRRPDQSLWWRSNVSTSEWWTPPIEVAFGTCADDLTCAYNDADPVNRGACAAEVSVCLYSYEEIYDFDLGGVCTEICDDGIDNDNDGIDTNSDGVFNVTFIDCRDPDCEFDEACFEWVCDDEVDDDGDGLVDCLDFDCCYAVSDACIEADPDNEGNNKGEGACDESAYCNDGIDNDMDGLTDCHDPDCPECQIIR